MVLQQAVLRVVDSPDWDTQLGPPFVHFLPTGALDVAAANHDQAVLIEINVGGEAAKSGILPDSPELENILQAAAHLQHLEIRGLMTVPPFTEAPQAARPFFRKLREIRDQIAAQRLLAVGIDVLSMGMSHDFEVAIEEGSTCVRVGTAIFGERI